MDKESGSQNIVTIVLVLLVLVFVAISGYLYLGSTNNNAGALKERDNKIAELSSKLRTERFDRNLTNTTVVSVDASANTIKAMDSKGKEVTLSVTGNTNIKKTVASKDYKGFKTLESANLQDVKDGAKATIIYNGLDEVVYLAVN